MRILPLSLIAVLSVSGCTNVVHNLRDEPIDPDPHKTTLGTSLNDMQIETGIGVNIKKSHPLLEKAHINVHSYNSVVLLTGEAPSQEMRSLAGDTARAFRSVRQVHNELQLENASSFMSRTNDGWITTKVKSKLVANDSVDSGKIKVVTEGGVVFLMGIISQELGNVAAQVASTTKGVKKVVKVFEYPEL